MASAAFRAGKDRAVGSGTCALVRKSLSGELIVDSFDLAGMKDGQRSIEFPATIDKDLEGCCGLGNRTRIGSDRIIEENGAKRLDDAGFLVAIAVSVSPRRSI
jgi:hypothetical protein